MALSFAELKDLVITNLTQWDPIDRIIGGELREVENAIIDKIQAISEATPQISGGVLTTLAAIDAAILPALYGAHIAIAPFHPVFNGDFSLITSEENSTSLQQLAWGMVGDELKISSRSGLKTGLLWGDWVTVSGEVKYTNATPSAVAVGGIPVGSTFSNKTNSEMWTMALYPELFPTVTATPSSAFGTTPSVMQEIGTVVATLTMSAAFNRGSMSPAYGLLGVITPDPYGFRSGLPNKYTYSGPGLSGIVEYLSTALTDAHSILNYAITSGPNAWINKVFYDAGAQPKSSYGNDYLAITPYPAGFFEKTATIIGAYPLFATTSNITTLTKQALVAMNSVYFQVNVVAESGSDKQRVEIPTSWSIITGIQFFNTINNSWEYIGGNKANSLLTFTESVEYSKEYSTGLSTNYTTFTHNGVTIGVRQLRFYTT